MSVAREPVVREDTRAWQEVFEGLLLSVESLTWQGARSRELVRSPSLELEVSRLRGWVERRGWQVLDLEMDFARDFFSFSAKRADGRRLEIRGTSSRSMLERSQDRVVHLGAGVRGPYPTEDVRQDFLGRARGTAHETFCAAIEYIARNPGRSR